MKLAKTMEKNENIVVTLSGRGDKDIKIIEEYTKKIKENNKYAKRSGK